MGKRTGKRCRRYVTQGRTKLCRIHFQQARREANAQGFANSKEHLKPFVPFDPSEADAVKGGLVSSVKGQAAKVSATAFVVNEQARTALGQLGLEPSRGFDPKTALLATVESAYRQKQVWEAMLAAVPEADFAQVGVTPIPGDPLSSKGARIEIMQRHLSEATKTAAKISKMAIDAGIEERLVRLAEEQSALIADTVRAAVVAAIGSLRLSSLAEKAAIEVALGAAGAHLRVLAAGGQDVVDGVARVVNVTPKEEVTV